jgi:diguanylate cyclase (GGDEF)-like protein
MRPARAVALVATRHRPTPATLRGRPSRRPFLLLLVYGICLVLVGVTASSQAAVVTGNYQATAMSSIVQDDAGLVRAIVNSFVKVTDLDPGPDATRRIELDNMLAAMADRDGLLRVEIRDVQGRVQASNVSLAGDAQAAIDEGMTMALAGKPSASLVDAASTGQPGTATDSVPLMRENLPLQTQDGVVRAVVVAWRNAQPILNEMEESRWQVVVLTLIAALVLSVVLFFVFKTAQDRIQRQAAALVEAARRDPATGLLNHGAAVEQLGAAVNAARLDGTSVGIALLDIDNFRLVNDTHGHAVGDEALLLVTDRLACEATPGIVVGRYGPDEFLVFAPGGVARLENAVRSVRDALASEILQDPLGGRLPITISAGICGFPGDGPSVTQLLAVVTRTLEGAKSGGGDAVRIASADLESADARGFDVLHGLVIAIDTKDRYTKRHSEDVARYGLFIADRLGLDAEARRTIRVAGLLHDVGKIGIPDHVLRKPGHLTDGEYEIVKQHVALGDAIVRDVPDIDAVRAGIRHHHERWDGRGYLHGLAGTDIPIVARILAVGDAFSAMTTSRPYRKALSVREAIVRLLDAAGTQLDEDVVRVFVEGIENAPDAPLPGAPMVPLWTPEATMLRGGTGGGGIGQPSCEPASPQEGEPREAEVAA